MITPDYNITLKEAKQRCIERPNRVFYVNIDSVTKVMDYFGRVYAKLFEGTLTYNSISIVEQHYVTIPKFDRYNIKILTSGHQYTFNLKENKDGQ